MNNDNDEMVRQIEDDNIAFISEFIEDYSAKRTSVDAWLTALMSHMVRMTHVELSILSQKIDISKEVAVNVIISVLEGLTQTFYNNTLASNDKKVH